MQFKAIKSLLTIKKLISASGRNQSSLLIIQMNRVIRFLIVLFKE